MGINNMEPNSQEKNKNLNDIILPQELNKISQSRSDRIMNIFTSPSASIILSAFLMLSLFGMAFFIAYQKVNKPNIPTNYEECAKTKGSIIRESYPAVCVTKDKKEFIQVIPEDEQNLLEVEDKQSIDTDNLIPEDWKAYTNVKYSYEVKYPPSWTTTERNSISYDFVSLLPPDSSSDSISSPGIIWIKAEKNNSLTTSEDDSLKIFQSFMNSCSSQTPTQCTQKNSDDYKFEKQISIAGKPAFQTYGGCCMDYGRHVFLYNNYNTYRFTLYNPGPNIPNLKNEDVFNQILSTFEFSD